MLANILDSLTVGLLGGLVYALSGLLKSVTKEGFDGRKFIRTLVLGMLAGVMLSLSGYEVTPDAISVALSSGVTAVIEQLLIAVYRAVMKSG
jgi:hypothetical protein